jgi:hypothetical protein
MMPGSVAPEERSQTPLWAIDWSVRPLATTLPLREGATAAEAQPWQLRFVNHLGATPERLYPNAKLRVNSP